MKTTFSSRIFRTIVPWVAILFLAASVLVFQHQAVSFISEKASDTEVIISDRADEFEQRFKEIKAQIAYVARFESVEAALSRYPDMNEVEKYRNSNQISSDLTGINLFNQYIEDIIIIGTNGFYKNLDSYGRLKSGIDPLSWDSIRGYTPGTSNFYFTLPYTADYYTTSPHLVFSVVLPVRRDNTVIGYIQGNLNYERVTDMLEKSSKNESIRGTTFGAVTNDGHFVFIEDSDVTSGEAVPTEIQSGITSDSGQFRIKDNGPRLIIYRKLSESGWIFLGIIHYRSMIKPVIREALFLLFLVLPVSIALMGVVIFFLARRIQRPVERLKNRVENVDIETYEPASETYEISEVQVVADRFEESMQRNQNLIRHVYEEELLRKDAELEVLRNQITPHFIYNSLQLIKTEAILSGNKEISRSVNALAGLLRYSMNSGTDTATLKEELDYIGNYLEIYRKRYVDRFTYRIESDPGLYPILIPKMILQPLVENSIRHGFAEIRSGGLIEVLVRMEDPYLLIRVEDNGCGISEERLQTLREELKEAGNAPGKGIGLLNVHRRIRLQCGEDSGITAVGNKSDGGFFQELRLTGISEKTREEASDDDV